MKREKKNLIWETYLLKSFFLETLEREGGGGGGGGGGAEKNPSTISRVLLVISHLAYS